MLDLFKAVGQMHISGCAENTKSSEELEGSRKFDDVDSFAKHRLWELATVDHDRCDPGQ